MIYFDHAATTKMSEASLQVLWMHRENSLLIRRVYMMLGRNQRPF